MREGGNLSESLYQKGSSLISHWRILNIECELDAIYLFRSLMIDEDYWEEWVYKFATVAEQLKQETLH